MGFLGSGISAAASVANTQDTNETNYRIARETNELNERLAREQNEWNLARRNEEWAYNDPSAQAQRLMSAGLSSAAAAQALSPGSAQPLQSANLANQQLPAPAVASDLSTLSGMNLIGAAREIMALKQDFLTYQKGEKELEFQEPFLLSELDAKNYANKLALQLFEFNAKSNPYKLESSKYAAQLGELQVTAQEIANRLAEANVARCKQEFEFARDLHQSEMDKLFAEIQNIKEKTKTEIKQQQVLDATKGNIQKDTQLKDVNIQVLGEDKIAKELENVFTRFGCPETTAERIGVLIAAGKVSPQTVQKALTEMRDALLTGRELMIDNEDTRKFYQYIINPGMSSSRKLGSHTSGSWRDAADDIMEALGLIK